MKSLWRAPRLKDFGPQSLIHSPTPSTCRNQLVFEVGSIACTKQSSLVKHPLSTKQWTSRPTSVNVRHMMAATTSLRDKMSLPGCSISRFNKRIAEPYLSSETVLSEYVFCRKLDIDAARQLIADGRACPCPPMLIIGRASTQPPQMRGWVCLFWGNASTSASGMKLCIISRTMFCTGLLSVLDSSREISDCGGGEKDTPLGEFVWDVNCLVVSFESFTVVLVTNMKSKG